MGYLTSEMAGDSADSYILSLLSFHVWMKDEIPVLSLEFLQVKRFTFQVLLCPQKEQYSSCYKVQ